MKRKALRSVLALASATALLLSGCGGDEIDTSGIDTTKPAAEAPAPAAETPAETPAEAPAETPAETADADPLAFEAGTVLRMATGYNNEKTGLRFDAETAGEGITLADGNTYHSGDFKPTWVEIQNRLGFTIEDKYQGKSNKEEFDYWKEQLDQVDIVNGEAATLQEYGEAGTILNIGQYLDIMPNLKAYLDENPIVRLSITGNTENGAIYFSPYFDGVDDIEKMPLMRVDWVQKLLDGEGAFEAAESDKTAAPVYQPFMPTEGKVDIEVVNDDGKTVDKITKDYDAAGNIVAKMNEAGSIDGVEAVNMLRTYIDEAYAGYYGTERSHLFVGQDAAWDADELVALLRCVCANSATLNADGQKVQGIFSREEGSMGRIQDVPRLGLILFGAMGEESRNGYLYFDKDGSLKDARCDVKFYEALSRMHDIAQEGLISESWMNQNADMKVKQYLENDLGFMEYDYNQTQTIYNEQEGIFDEGEKFMAVMVPVSRWDDGTGEKFMRYTQSWRSVKPIGWAVSAKGVEGDENKLHAALKLIDYAYSDEGQILLSYGPDAFIKTNADGSYVTFDLNGEQWPEISDATREDLWKLAGGNYTNFARFYIGSTLSFKKLQSFEYQCTTEAGKEGAGYISNAIALGLIKHPMLAITSDNYWWSSVPTTLPYTKPENEDNGNLTDLATTFGNDFNAIVDIVAKGFAIEGMTNPETAAETVASTYKCNLLVQNANDAWKRLEAFYTSQN